MCSQIRLYSMKKRIAFIVASIGLCVLMTVPAHAAGDAWTKVLGASVYSIASNNTRVIVGRRDNRVSAFDRAGTMLWEFETQGTVYGVAISEDSSVIAVGSEDRNLYLLDGNGKELWKSRAAQTFASVSISSDGAVIAAGNEDRSVYTFNRAGQLKWKFGAGPAMVSSPLTVGC